MGFKCGIVGLPNVGKSTLFNALTQTISAESANYPFCTIEPNAGVVSVPDSRLEKLGVINKSQKILPTKLEFLDIAGLVKGASKGEGLGNQFLANIREVDAIIHVVRCFESTEITHVEGNVDPLRDIEIIETELLLSDLESLEKRLPNLEKKAKNGDKESVAILPMVKTVLEALHNGKAAISVKPEDKDDLKIFKGLNLLTSKPVLYACNVSEEEAQDGNEHSNKVKEWAEKEGNKSVVISAEIEKEISTLESDEEKQEFLETLGLSETGLNKVIREGYDLLDLITYFTSGPTETRAWTITRGTKAPQAAGVIHTDFEQGFIRSETISYEDYISCGGEVKCKEAGKMRVEGKDYEMQDGDVCHFLFNK
ncbi:MAG: redox-regulated ATPase YchF [Alphaproteobacteria bacterium]|nr:redox-regulated ATPase YchF [Alphaproteobacteria bacterium]